MQLVATDIGSAHCPDQTILYGLLYCTYVFLLRLPGPAEKEVKASDFNFAGLNFMHDAVNSWCVPHFLCLPTYTVVEGNYFYSIDKPDPAKDTQVSCFLLQDCCKQKKYGGYDLGS